LLKEFLDPLRTGDALADFYNVYRRESENFDRDYVGRYSQDLDMTLLFVSHTVSCLVPKFGFMSI